MSDAPATSTGRRMKYPYTYTAKMAQFPYKFYFANSWLYKYWVVGLVCSLPIFYKIHTAGTYYIWLVCVFINQHSPEIGLDHVTFTLCRRERERERCNFIRLNEMNNYNICMLIVLAFMHYCSYFHLTLYLFLFVFTVNSPANVRLWEEKDRKEAAEHHGH